MGDLLNSEQLEILGHYRNQGAPAEFLEDFVEEDENNPFIIPPHQRAALYAIWDYSFVYLNWCRRSGKTFVFGNAPLAMGAMLSGAGVSLKIGLYSGTFSQVKLDFAELTETWKRSPFLQSLTEKEPRVGMGSCEMRFKGAGNTEGILIQARPLSAQRKSDSTRGFGFPLLFIDEFQLLPESSYAAILPQFTVSGNPVLRMRRRRERGQIGHQKKVDATKNRIILAGTSSYQFVPAYRIFSMVETWSVISRLSKELLDDFSGAT